MPACHAGGRGFESRPDRLIDQKPEVKASGFFVHYGELSLLKRASRAQKDMDANASWVLIWIMQGSPRQGKGTF